MSKGVHSVSFGADDRDLVGEILEKVKEIEDLRQSAEDRSPSAEVLQHTLELLDGEASVSVFVELEDFPERLRNGYEAIIKKVNEA